LKVIALSVGICRGLRPGEISFPHYDSGVPGVAEVPALVQTAADDLLGTVENGVAVWRGVPYAQQPVGERRFAAPAPLSPWTGVRDAVEHGPPPPQSRSMVANDRRDPTVRDEACLTVTVWSPDVSGSLPVIVWIPGGAFLNAPDSYSFTTVRGWLPTAMSSSSTSPTGSGCSAVSNSATSVTGLTTTCVCVTRSPR
jgi:hypothetical protein